MSARTTAMFAAIVCGVSGTAMAGTWSDLWSTHEQQGQKLLESNHPGEAAQLFSDPKRRAYAQLRAGQYDKAADLLAPLKDADSQYNRGNALAHTGKLRDALAAYDSALANSPGNKDVMRNRELVAKALEDQKRQQQQGKSGASDKNGQGQQNPSNGGGQSSNGSGDKQSGDKQSGGKDSSSQDSKAGQAGNQSQAAQRDQSGSQDQSGNQGQANAQNQADHQGQTGSQQQAANPSGQRGQRAATALQQGQTSGTGTQRGPADMTESPLVKGATAADSPNTQPRSEQALSLDQWMRSIPEDSGELLRRKFQIEHLMRQQGNQP